MKREGLLAALLLVAANWVFADEPPNLDDPKIRQKILKESVGWESFEKRGASGEELVHLKGEKNPYTGWMSSAGDTWIAELSHYKDGKRDGPATEWYRDGQKKEEATFKDGKLVGVCSQWWPNGQKKEEWHFKDGKPEGQHTQWWESGTKRQECTFKDGKPEGLWTEWDREGNVRRQTRYKDGVEVRR